MASATITPSPQTTQSHSDTCSAHANPTWREAVLAATVRLAARQESFTSGDVLLELEKSDITTHDLRAMGGVLQEARDLGLITAVGFVRRNDRYTRAVTTLWSRLCPTQTAHANSQPSEGTEQPQ